MTHQDQDTVSVRNLQLPFGITAPDVWGKSKEQPALISLTLFLRHGFDTAAQQDALDNSTIHYGQLAKRIRGSCAEGQTVDTVTSNAQAVIADMGMKADGRFIVARAAIEVSLPKASMFGDGVELVSEVMYGEDGVEAERQHVFGVRNVMTMTLIGVNAYERTARQPVVASIWVYLSSQPNDDVTSPDELKVLFRLEQRLVQIIQETSYETLESLANFAIKQLQVNMLDQATPGARVRLRLEKPRAIAFADAPAVEVVRGMVGRAEIPSAVSGSERIRLNIIKPYHAL